MSQFPRVGQPLDGPILESLECTRAVSERLSLSGAQRLRLVLSPATSFGNDGGWKLSIQFLHSIGRQIWQRCKSVPLQNSFAVVDSEFIAYTSQSNFCSGLSQRQGTSTIYDSRRGSSGFELWESLSSGHVTTRLGSMSPQRLRSPRLTLATKKLSTGANGQKEDAASFSCRRSTVSSLIDLPVSLMMVAQWYDLPIVAFGVRGTGHEYLFARAG